MRHRKKFNSSFGLKQGPKKALLRNLINSLVEKERIKTTLPKAKAIRPLIEKAITLGRRGDVHARRLILSDFSSKKTVSKIVDDLSKRFQDRPGGYTRILKIGQRPGDNAKKALIEFVDYKPTPKLTKEEKEKHKASKEYKTFQKLTTKKVEKKRKKIRKIQSKSRQINRSK